MGWHEDEGDAASAIHWGHHPEEYSWSSSTTDKWVKSCGDRKMDEQHLEQISKLQLWLQDKSIIIFLMEKQVCNIMPWPGKIATYLKLLEI